jgi:hypothetical protein
MRTKEIHEYLKERRYLKHLGIDGKILLRLLYRKQGLVGTGFIRLKPESSSEIMRSYELFKRRGIS